MNNEDMKLKDKIAFDVHPKLSEDFSKKTLNNIYINKKFSRRKCLSFQLV